MKLRALGVLGLPGVASIFVVWLACSVPDVSYVGKACTGACPAGLACVDGVCSATAPTDAESPVDSGCLTPATGDPCVTLPAFPGDQQIDGLAADFCGVPAFVFDPSREQPTNAPEPNNPGLALKATVQAAWSGGPNAAFHVFVHVPKWPVLYFGPEIWEGDAVEILVAGSAPADLTGDAGGDPGTTHIILAPTLDGGSGRAIVYPVNEDLTGPVTPVSGPLPASQFFARIEPLVGYDVELEIPWSTLGPPYPVAGAAVGFEVGIDVALPDADGGLNWYQSFHKVLALTGNETGNGSCNTDPHPACDDRTWCQPTLTAP